MLALAPLHSTSPASSQRCPYASPRRSPASPLRPPPSPGQHVCPPDESILCSRSFAETVKCSRGVDGTPAKMDSSQPIPIVEHSFSCVLCGERAGLVQLFGTTDAARFSWGPPGLAKIVVYNFVCTTGGPVAPNLYQSLYSAISKGDAAKLYRADFEFTPFYCPSCKACYCEKHWHQREVIEEGRWFDCVLGTCPYGHERMLVD